MDGKSKWKDCGCVRYGSGLGALYYLTLCAEEKERSFPGRSDLGGFVSAMIGTISISIAAALLSTYLLRRHHPGRAWVVLWWKGMRL